MKPLLSESQDQDALRMLGRASVQIVHDLKNQLNGLKLYATFLKKRLEKGGRPAEELETIDKLIEGLDRMAKDTSSIADYGQPLELKKQAGTDLEKVVRQIAAEFTVENSPVGNSIVVNAGPRLLGDFDPVLLAEALKSISLSAMKMVGKTIETPLEIQLKDEVADSKHAGVIEWKISDSSDHDPFHSFAGSNEIRLSLAARIIEAHGGSARRENGALCVRLPLGDQQE